MPSIRARVGDAVSGVFVVDASAVDAVNRGDPDRISGGVHRVMAGRVGLPRHVPAPVGPVTVHGGCTRRSPQLPHASRDGKSTIGRSGDAVRNWSIGVEPTIPSVHSGNCSGYTLEADGLIWIDSSMP